MNTTPYPHARGSRRCVFFVASLLALTLAACGDDGTSAEDDTSANNTTTNGTNSGTTTSSNNASTSTNNGSSATNNATSTATNNGTTTPTNNGTTSTNNGSSTSGTNNTATATNNGTTTPPEPWPPELSGEDGLVPVFDVLLVGDDEAVIKGDVMCTRSPDSATCFVWSDPGGPEWQEERAGLDAAVASEVTINDQGDVFFVASDAASETTTLVARAGVGGELLWEVELPPALEGFERMNPCEVYAGPMGTAFVFCTTADRALHWVGPEGLIETYIGHGFISATEAEIYLNSNNGGGQAQLNEHVVRVAADGSPLPFGLGSENLAVAATSGHVSADLSAWLDVGQFGNLGFGLRLTTFGGAQLAYHDLEAGDPDGAYRAEHFQTIPGVDGVGLFDGIRGTFVVYNTAGEERVRVEDLPVSYDEAAMDEAGNIYIPYDDPDRDEGVIALYDADGEPVGVIGLGSYSAEALVWDSGRLVAFVRGDSNRGVLVLAPQ